MEVASKVEVLPTVGVPDGDIKFPVQAAQSKQALEEFIVSITLPGKFEYVKVL